MSATQNSGQGFIIKLLRYGLVYFLLLPATFALRADDYTNQLAKAANAYTRQDYATALACFSNAMRLQTNQPVPYMGRAATYLSDGSFELAKSDFDKAIELSTNAMMLSYAYLQRGYFYQQTTNYEPAIEDFSRAIQINPASPAAYTYRAYVFMQQGHFDLANIDCNMAIMLNPKQANAFRYKGYALKMVQDDKNAIEAYSRAIKLETNIVSDYYQRAGAYFDEKDYPDTIADFNRAIQLDPTNSELYTSRGLCRSKMNDFKNGISDCEKAYQLNTNSIMACNNLAWLLTIAPKTSMRNGNKAVELASRACELSSWKNAYPIGTLAAAYAETGDFDKAVTWERKCILLGLPETEMHQAHVELDLFEQRKPYHAD